MFSKWDVFGADSYIQPEIWVEELKAECPLLVNSITKIHTNLGSYTLGYGGGGSGPARAGENNLWDDEDDDTDWDQL